MQQPKKRKNRLVLLISAYLHTRQLLRTKCSRLELFFPMFSLLTVSAAQVIDCFLVPFSLSTRTFRGLLSIRDSPDSVIVADDDCTQGKHILLLIFSQRRLMNQYNILIFNSQKLLKAFSSPCCPEARYPWVFCLPSLLSTSYFMWWETWELWQERASKNGPYLTVKRGCLFTGDLTMGPSRPKNFSSRIR
jgi:hypothetical protein